MYFTIIFILFIASIAVISFKMKDSLEFLSIASFITGITQMLMLFAFFLSIFNGVRKSEFTINANGMLLMYMLDFSAVLIFLGASFIKFKIEKKILTKPIIMKELFQLYLPVIILNLSIRFLSSFDSNEHIYIYARLVNQYFYVLFFKLIFSLSTFFLIKIINNSEKM